MDARKGAGQPANGRDPVVYPRSSWWWACPLLLASPLATASMCRIGAPTQVYVDGVLTSLSGNTISVPVGTTSIQISADVEDVTPGSCTTHSLRDAILSDSTGGAYTFFDGANYLASINYSGFPGPFSNQINISLRNFSPGQIVAEVNCLDCTGTPPRQQYTINVVPAPVAEIPDLPDAAGEVAEVIDELCPDLPSNSTDPNVIDLRANCLALIAASEGDPEGVTEALGELFSDVAVVQAEVQQLSTQAQYDNIRTRTESLRNGAQGVDLGGLALNLGPVPLPLGLMLHGLQSTDEKSGEVGRDFSRWGFFASGNIGRGKADAGSANAGYDFDIHGLTVGVDYRQSDRLALGLALGYSRQGNDLRLGQGSLDTSGWTITGYGTYYRDASWYSDFSVSLGRSQFDMARVINFTVATPTGTTTVNQLARADSSGRSFGLAASLGRDFSKGAWTFGPYLRTLYGRDSFDAMTEKLIAGQAGAGLALVIKARETTALSSVLGGKLTRAHSTNWGVLVPHVEVEWQREYRTNPANLEAYFLFDPNRTPFVIAGEPVDKSFVRVGTGLSFVATKGRSGFMYYEKILGKQRISQDGIAMGLRFEF
jgi:outer membrane autotransporter protein